MLSLYNTFEVILLVLTIPTYFLYAVELHTIVSARYDFRHSSFHLLFFAIGLTDFIAIPLYEYSFKFQYWFPSISLFGTSNNALSVLWYFGMSYPTCVVLANLFFIAVNRVTAVLMPLRHTRIWERGVYYAIGTSFLMGLIPTWPCFQMIVTYKPYVKNNVTQLARYIDNYWIKGYLLSAYMAWYSVALVAIILILHLITGVALWIKMRGNTSVLLRFERSLLILSLVLALSNCALCVQRMAVTYLTETGQNDLVNDLFLYAPFLADANTLNRPWVLLIADTPLRGVIIKRMRGWFGCQTARVAVAEPAAAAVPKRRGWLQKAEPRKNKQNLSFVAPSNTATQ